MKLEEIGEAAAGVGQLIFAVFGTNIVLFIISIIGWPFIVTIGLIVGAVSLVGAVVVGLFSLVASFFD